MVSLAAKVGRLGFVTGVVGDAELYVVALAKRLPAYPLVGMKNIKRSFNVALESSLSATWTLEAEYDAACYRSPEPCQALKDFIASRKKR